MNASNYVQKEGELNSIMTAEKEEDKQCINASKEVNMAYKAILMLYSFFDKWILNKDKKQEDVYWPFQALWDA